MIEKVAKFIGYAVLSAFVIAFTFAFGVVIFFGVRVEISDGSTRVSFDRQPSSFYVEYRSHRGDEVVFYEPGEDESSDVLVLPEGKCLRFDASPWVREAYKERRGKDLELRQ